MIGLIQRKSGQAREQVEAYVDSLFRGDGSTSERVKQLAHDYSESASQAFSEGYQEIADRARRGYDQTAEVVANRPFESIFAALGVGLVTGIAIGLSIGAQRRPEPSWRDHWYR